MRIVLVVEFLFLAIFRILFSQAADSSAWKAPAASSIELRTFVEENKVPLNRQVIFHIELAWNGDLSRYQIEKIPQPMLTDLVMEGSGSSNRIVPLKNGVTRAIKTISYQFKPLELGMAYIDGISIKYRDTVTGTEDILNSQRVMVEITDAIPDGSGPGSRALLFIILFVVFFGTIFYFIIVYFRRRKQAAIPVEPPRSTAEIYLEKLSSEVDLKNKNLAAMCGRLSRLFRDYFRDEFKLPYQEVSTQELLEQLTGKIEPPQLERVKQVLEKLDVVKFAAGNIDPAEFANLYGAVETLLIQRKQLWETQQVQVKEA